MPKLRMALVAGVGIAIIFGGAFAQKSSMNFGSGTSAQVTVSPGAMLTAVAAVVEGRHQQVTIVDPVGRSMAVYHIRLDSGQIELKSVRNIHWDLQLVEFNGVRPLPQEIQSVVSGSRP